MKKIFLGIVIGLCALANGADAQFAGGIGAGFDKFFSPTITLNEIIIECACPDVSPRACATTSVPAHSMAPPWPI